MFHLRGTLFYAICIPFCRALHRRLKTLDTGRRLGDSNEKKRWAAIKGQSQAKSLAGSEPPKRRISEDGMKRIVAATKKRWALKRAEEAKANRAAAKGTRARNAALKAA